VSSSGEQPFKVPGAAVSASRHQGLRVAHRRALWTCPASARAAPRKFRPPTHTQQEQDQTFVRVLVSITDAPAWSCASVVLWIVRAVRPVLVRLEFCCALAAPRTRIPPHASNERSLARVVRAVRYGARLELDPRRDGPGGGRTRDGDSARGQVELWLLRPPWPCVLWP